MLKKLFFFILLLFLSATTLSAQTSANPEKQALYNAEVREKLALDYSMPDFSTSKIDGNIIGTRLALMLQRLQNTYTDAVNNQYLSILVCEQNEGLNYVTIENLKIKNISKSGDVITIISSVKLSKNPLGIKKTDTQMVFTQGLSDNKAVNSLFSNLARYINEE